MDKIVVKTYTKKILGDTLTPVQIYLNLRGMFSHSLLLESTDFQTISDSWSVIALEPITGIEMKQDNSIEITYPQSIVQIPKDENINEVFNRYYASFQVENEEESIPYAQGLFGYSSYELFLKHIGIRSTFDLNKEQNAIPILTYSLYKFVLIFSHFNDEVFICQNIIDGVEQEPDIQSILDALDTNKHTPPHFQTLGSPSSNMTDEQYLDMVRKGISHCQRGDVFQIVLSRRYQCNYEGDDFQLYRQLRNVNPSPYLFYYDYKDYKIFGSSPESQLIIKKGKAIIHPIAGTYKRTGDDTKDAALAIELSKDKKENAEHTMLVDLARNDLSIFCSNTQVSRLKDLKYYSHLIHMVSEVTSNISSAVLPFEILLAVSPAGTLSGAPKKRAMELIDKYEPTTRSYYGGTVGFLGLNGDVNHAICIRTFLSKSQTLFFQAGGGIVIHSKPENELQEVHNKLNALRKAMEQTENLKF